MNFNLTPDLEKRNDKILKTLKNLIFGQFDPSLPIFWGKNFSWKIGLCQFLDFTVIYQAKNQKKLMSGYQKKLLTNGQIDRQTDRRTVNSDFIERSIYGDTSPNIDEKRTFQRSFQIIQKWSLSTNKQNFRSNLMLQIKTQFEHKNNLA